MIDEGQEVGDMKRYLVFAFATYYPGGGSADVVGSYDSLEEARKNGGGYDYREILDRVNGVWLPDTDTEAPND